MFYRSRMFRMYLIDIRYEIYQWISFNREGISYGFTFIDRSLPCNASSLRDIFTEVDLDSIHLDFKALKGFNLLFELIQSREWQIFYVM